MIILNGKWDLEGGNHNSTLAFTWKNSEKSHEKHQSGQTATRSRLWIPMFLHIVIVEQVGIIMGKRSRYSDWLRAGRPRSRSSSPGRVKKVLSSTSSNPALGSTKPPTQWVPGDLSQGVKRQGREADHSTPTSAEVKNTRIYTSTPPYDFVAFN
jgi:hypothetical protein